MKNIEWLSKDFTADERANLIKQVNVSGLRYDEFARDHNINEQTIKNCI